MTKPQLVIGGFRDGCLKPIGPEASVAARALEFGGTGDATSCFTLRIACSMLDGGVCGGGGKLDCVSNFDAGFTPINSPQRSLASRNQQDADPGRSAS